MSESLIESQMIELERFASGQGLVLTDEDFAHLPDQIEPSAVVVDEKTISALVLDDERALNSAQNGGD